MHTPHACVRYSSVWSLITTLFVQYTIHSHHMVTATLTCLFTTNHKTYGPTVQRKGHTRLFHPSTFPNPSECTCVCCMASSHQPCDTFIWLQPPMAFYPGLRCYTADGREGGCWEAGFSPWFPFTWLQLGFPGRQRGPGARAGNERPSSAFLRQT